MWEGADLERLNWTALTLPAIQIQRGRLSFVSRLKLEGVFALSDSFTYSALIGQFSRCFYTASFFSLGSRWLIEVLSYRTGKPMTTTNRFSSVFFEYF